MLTRFTRPAVLSATVLAAAIGLAVAAPASAATRISFGELVPASPVYAIDSIIVTGKCTIADAPARMTDAYPLQWPEVPAAQAIDAATSTVQLDLDSRGALVSEAIANSSGNQLLDDEALLVARLSRYAPEVRNCNRFARSYFMDVAFE